MRSQSLKCYVSKTVKQQCQVTSTYTALPLALSFRYLRKREKKLSISVSNS